MSGKSVIMIAKKNGGLNNWTITNVRYDSIAACPTNKFQKIKRQVSTASVRLNYFFPLLIYVFEKKFFSWST